MSSSQTIVTIVVKRMHALEEAICESNNILKSIKLEEKYGIPKEVDLVGITNKDLIIICLKAVK